MIPYPYLALNPVVRVALVEQNKRRIKRVRDSRLRARVTMLYGYNEEDAEAPRAFSGAFTAAPAPRYEKETTFIYGH